MTTTLHSLNCINLLLTIQFHRKIVYLSNSVTLCMNCMDCCNFTFSESLKNYMHLNFCGPFSKHVSLYINCSTNDGANPLLFRLNSFHNQSIQGRRDNGDCFHIGIDSLLIIIYSSMKGLMLVKKIR